MTGLRIGSLFSGIGGLELGLEAATGGHVVWQVEREEWPRRVLAKHWPDADRSVTDVCEASAANLAPVDLICGGFPCQDISPAGKGAGITGEKSGLWREYARLVRELRPRFVVVENSHLLPVRGLGVVLGDLAGLGYDAEWARIGACDVGAPHRRWRTFVVAWLADAHSNGRAGQGHVAPRPKLADRAGEPGVLADADRKRLEGRQRVRLAGAQPQAGRECARSGRSPSGHHALPASDLRRVADGLPGWLGHGPVPRAIGGPDLKRDGRAALRALGNAVVPAVAYEVGLWLMRTHNQAAEVAA